MTWTGARGHTQIVHGAGEVRKTLEERNNISRKFTSEVCTAVLFFFFEIQ